MVYRQIHIYIPIMDGVEKSDMNMLDAPSKEDLLLMREEGIRLAKEKDHMLDTNNRNRLLVPNVFTELCRYIL